MDSSFFLSSYTFDLPESLIAQHPAQERAGSKLMCLPRHSGAPVVDSFANLEAHLPKDCLLVANNSRVVPARVLGHRQTGGRVEMLILTPLPLLSAAPCGEGGQPAWSEADAEVLLRSSKKATIGEVLVFDQEALLVEVLERMEYGRCRVRLRWQGELLPVLERLGSLPLPPYIKRAGSSAIGGGEKGEENIDDELRRIDAERYQTTYSRVDKSGSVAAPTAGLHFTPSLRQSLLASGREWAEVTLYVGYGTFSPVRCQDIREHAMHPEYVDLPESTAQAICKARAEGRKIVAVGTTSARTLEGVWQAQHGSAVVEQQRASYIGAHQGWVNIFLYPGQPFRVIDGLITNFHLPESSLLMLVSAFAGRERVLAAYEEAISRQFRFFSYGDAMCII